MAFFTPLLAPLLLLAEPATARTDDPTPPAAAAPIRVAVPDMTTSGVDADLARTLTEVVTVEAAKVEGLEVIGMTDIKAILGHEQQKMLLGCDDVTCMAEIGGALGVGVIVASHLGKVGDTYALRINVIDTNQVKVLDRKLVTVEGKPDALIRAIGTTVRPLLAPLVQPPKDTTTTAAMAAPVSTPEPGVMEVPKKSLSMEAEADLDLNWSAIGLMGLGGAGVVAGAVFLVLSTVTYSDVDNEAYRFDGQELQGQGSQRQIFDAQLLGWSGVGGLALGAAALTAGIIWQLLGSPDPEEVR